ncbi:hypothetical protein EJD97_022993 [Solanum chilense]|uniref:Uncharacterized protein n=1 Tax=Solanum chilense TaxID=4083 RepID=A0A6N2ASR4_SOLCI|nr:hypothetical protein EJD97_022993 [Solanum chilense]
MTSLAGNVNHENGIFRLEANFSPSLWGNTFSNSTRNNQISEKVIEEIEGLKEEVKHMIISTTTTSNDIEQKIYLIDTLERLGIYYHFEKEIEDQLSKMFDQNVIHEEDDLHKIALYFRLFRQHGYPISSDYFNQFKDNNGEFKKTLVTNTKGLLSLYEATHVRKHGDDILEDALVFAKFHLEKITNVHTLDSTLEKQVTHALMQSLHRGIPRAEAHFNISIYEECESRNEKLLRLAKLDYNLLQVLHKEELCELTQWWKDLDFASKLSYVRDRMVECFFWAVGVYFEPQYSQARVMLAKCIAMISVIDDTYDSYGTLDELIIFTEVVDRWDIKEVDRLPTYMKPIYISLLNLFKEYEIKIELEQDRFNGVHYVKEAMKEIVKSYYIEAEWFLEGKIPSFKEYLGNALVTGTYYLLGPASLLGMKLASKKTFDWMMNKPKILVASAIIGRVIDDIATYKIEKEKGQLVTGIECYMQENNLSVEEASAQLSEIAENAWKDLNNECIKTTDSMPNEILMRVVNLTRLIDVVYKNNQDGYSDPKNNVKDVIEALLVNSIIM